MPPAGPHAPRGRRSWGAPAGAPQTPVLQQGKTVEALYSVHMHACSPQQQSGAGGARRRRSTTSGSGRAPSRCFLSRKTVLQHSSLCYSRRRLASWRGSMPARRLTAAPSPPPPSRHRRRQVSPCEPPPVAMACCLLAGEYSAAAAPLDGWLEADELAGRCGSFGSFAGFCYAWQWQRVLVTHQRC